ncbi:replication/maintenance protein RepL [Acetobacter senegalensis]|uniref:replication/maintenance protein RepL n=1 Tax=Acetobacter senegalensis TaxID=446692 RepID=UPI00264FF5CE|nr:replication/maintenance protein RepL [Acetobacter senegalensis]MDN7352167.1 replication/maintenance protein RepL [Acetobacter senegalensis]
MKNISQKTPSGQWVQTERAAHEAWAELMGQAPQAARLMHLLSARVGDHNAVVISQKTLASLMGVTDRTVRTALKVLQAGNWLEIMQIGERGTVNAYVLNDRVVWSGPRDGLRYSLFSATVVANSAEQRNNTPLEKQEPLRRLPTLYPGERQLPTGPGMPPPSQPSIDGLEPDLPARRKEPQQSDLEDYTGRPGR